MARKRKEATPHLRIRIEPGLLARLEKSRTENSRTLTGEIVHRIEQTFRKSDDADLATLVYQAAFGERTGDLLRAFATAIWLIERRTGKKWHEDFDTAFWAVRAIEEIVRWFAGARRDPATDAAHLKYGDLSSYDDLPLGFGISQSEAEQLRAAHEKLEKTKAVADTAVLETLQMMGMAPSDAEIDEAAAKYRADPKFLKVKERFAKYQASEKAAREPDEK